MQLSGEMSSPVVCQRRINASHSGRRMRRWCLRRFYAFFKRKYFRQNNEYRYRNWHPDRDISQLGCIPGGVWIWCPVSPFSFRMLSTVMSNCVIEHIGDVESALLVICRVLKDGGKFWFTVHRERCNNYFICSRFLTALGMTAAVAYLTKRSNKRLEYYNIPHIDTLQQLLK